MRGEERTKKGEREDRRVRKKEDGEEKTLKKLANLYFTQKKVA